MVLAAKTCEGMVTAVELHVQRAVKKSKEGGVLIRVDWLFIRGKQQAITVYSDMWLLHLNGM
jgi:hypothetical protein